MAARQKGSFSLGGTLEILADAPADARLCVKTKSELTDVNSYPYKYIGMIVSVADEGKAYILTAADTTTASNWKELGEGGGGTAGSVYTGTLLANGWNDSNQQTVTFTSYSADYNGVIGIPADATSAQMEAYRSAVIRTVSQSNATVTFECESVPSIDLPVEIYCGGGSGSGGGGHTIENDGTALTQRDTLNLIDFDASDDSTNEKTQVKSHRLTQNEISEIMSNLPTPGQTIVIDDTMSSSSENPVQNKVITDALTSKADLVSGKVPAAQLPSYVDDVIEGYLYNGAFYEDDQYQNLITPENGKIYVDLAGNSTYRWSGSVYVEIGGPITVDSAMSDSSTNPVQNMVITTALASKADLNSSGKVPTSQIPTYSFNNLSSRPTKSVTSIDSIMTPLPGVTPRMMEYSTDEQIVGHWIDGKPIYQQTIVNTTLTSVSSGGGWSSYANIPGAESLVSFRISRRNSSGNAQDILNAINGIIENNYLKVNTLGSSSISMANGSIATIQYTKTTD